MKIVGCFKQSILFVLCLLVPVGCATSQAGSPRKAKVSFQPEKYFQEPPSKRINPRNVPEGNSYYFYLLSKLESYEGNLENSLYFLDKAIDQNHRSSFLEEERARQDVEANRIEDALAAAQKAVDLNPRNAEAQLLLGKLYSARKQHDQAVAKYQEVLRLEPKNEEAFAALAREYLVQKQIDQALQVIRKLKAEVPNSLTASYYLGTIYSSFKKNYHLAIESFKDILEDNPDEIRALQALGQLYLEQNDLKEALKVYQTLEKILPEDLTTQLRLGLLFYEMKNYEAAVESFKKILEISPNADRVQYYLGVVYMTQKKDLPALEAFSQVPSDSSFYKDAVIRSVLLLQDQSRTREALTLMEKALTQKGDVPEFYDAYAALYSSEREFDKAIGILNEGIEKFPKDDKLYFSLGVALDKKGDFEGSMRTMRKVIDLNPKQAAALNYIGYSYAEKGIHLDEAYELVSKAVALRPKDGYILDSFGWVLFKRGDVARATHYLLKADELAPNEPTILEHLGDVFLERGSLKKAQDYYQRAVEVIGGRVKKEEGDLEDLARIKKKLSEKVGLR